MIESIGPFLPLLLGAAAFLLFMAWAGTRKVEEVPPADGPATEPPVRAAATATAELGPYRAALDAAGVRDPAKQLSFAAIHAGATIGGAALGPVLAGPDAPLLATLLLAGLGAFVGWWLPRSWLEARRTRRRVEMATDLPVALDLLQIGLEGGMGLHAAWGAVCSSLSGANDALAGEMRRIEIEVGFGSSWGHALASATERTGLPEFRALGSLLEQTERFGTEMVRMIRVMSDTIRHDAVHALEERAHRASVMLLVPLSGLLLPASLILMFMPPFILLLEGMSRASP